MLGIAESPLDMEKLFTITEVSGEDVDLDAVPAAQILAGLLQPRGVPSHQDEVVTTLGQSTGKRMTDAGGCAGDQCGAHGVSLTRTRRPDVLP